MSNFKLTEEQVSIIESNHDNMLVEAGAGTSKTFTLIEKAKAHNDLRILYLAFNRSVKEEAEAKFPRNVTVATTHSHPYQFIGKKYSHKLEPFIKPYALINALGLKGKSRLQPKFMKVLAKRIIGTISNYLVSDDLYVLAKHVDIDMQNPLEREHLNPREIAMYATDAWNMMKDINTDRLPMLHDGYLKLFSMSNQPYINLRTGREFDMIMLDERQDTNPVTMSIVNRQAARKVLVGDRHQAIYGFRGALDGASSFETDNIYKLSGSFRYGQDIANAANKLLFLKGSDFIIKGLGPKGELRYKDDYENLSTEIAGSKVLSLARTSSSICLDAVSWMKSGKQIAFMGGIKSYKFSEIDDIYALRYGGEIRDPMIQMYESYEELRQVAKESDDYEINAAIKLIDTYGQEWPTILNQLHQSSSADESKADIVFSTIHKAKGLESDTVLLSEDIVTLKSDFHLEKGGDVKNKSNLKLIEEYNLGYVAITRAKSRLILPEHSRKLFEHTGVQNEVKTRTILDTINKDKAHLDNHMSVESLINKRRNRML